jgi:glycosyltransferase involved in cell wall biosynthesis
MPAELDLETASLVTIAIPTFNRLEYLKEAVASALAQTYERIEVLIGDDGTTEAIRQWGQSLASREPRVRYQRNQKNLGLAGNWNALSDAARGRFLVIIGDDDRLLPEFVEKLIGIIQASAAHLAFANHYLIDNQGTRLTEESLRHTRQYRRDRLPAGEVANPAACVWQKSIPLSASLMRTADMRRLRFKEDVNVPEIETFAWLAHEGGRFVFTPEYLSEYRTHSQSYTAAGLTSEKLVDYMMPIPVPPEVEPYKREFMAELLVNAVSRCLHQGERERARQFLTNEYYPHWNQGAVPPRDEGADLHRRNGHLRISRVVLTAWAQRLCARLPAEIGCPLYRSIQRAKAAVSL